jgi:hypothetical protein
MKPASAIAAALAATLASCTSLLPSGDESVQSPWGSFEQAKSAMEAIEPHRTTVQDLSARGLDPFTDPNIELLHYSDILRRFPLSGPADRFDPGLRECLQAGKACSGYAIDIRENHQQRVGPFLLDLLSFRRETRSSGWTFNALLLMVDGRVVYTLWGGKPAIAETSKKIEPLGPFQDFNPTGLVR